MAYRHGKDCASGEQRFHPLTDCVPLDRCPGHIVVGDVPAGGRTVAQIASDIQDRISAFKRGAKVDVALVQANSTAITVLGEVRGPSSFPLLKETRVCEALGKVGGLTTFAKSDEVRVIRTIESEAFVYIVDMDAIMRGDQTTNIVLTSGDIVYAPARHYHHIRPTGDRPSIRLAITPAGEFHRHDRPAGEGPNGR